MPKIKTHSGAKKRFRKTATGRWKFKSPGRRHLLYQEPSKIKRPKRKNVYVGSDRKDAISKMLPYA
ncbi:MAG: 50S ribosomal protein L35 [Candidatus Goldbacteria bacterium]|nr:50S ribosomal protein L35 [Candidatus Goldiibacteriota bacterium]HPD19311.1 50S ribosomal protein L35 [Candidatus Goldiibacteriota bacterium]